MTNEENKVLIELNNDVKWLKDKFQEHLNRHHSYNIALVAAAVTMATSGIAVIISLLP